MAKIALLGDIHFSIKNGNPIFQENIRRFFTEYFFPIIKKENVNIVLQSGDAFDNRKMNNTEAIKNAKECFFDVLEESNIEYHQIVGNHEAYYRESLDLNSPEIYLSEYDNVFVYKSPKTITIGDKTIDMIPWICDSNREEISKFMQNSKSDIVFGHFEINGFAMSKNNYCDHGISVDTFKKYKKVWSGHFHRKMQIGNINYIGSPSQLTWDDEGDERGFYIYDTDADDMVFYKNPFDLYVKFEYTDDLEIKNTPDIEGRFVKIIANNVKDKKRQEEFVAELHLFNPIEIKVSESVEEIAGIDVSLDDLESGSFDTVKFLHEYTIKNNEALSEDEVNLVLKEYTELYNMAIRGE